jgi:hypothetical protein
MIYRPILLRYKEIIRENNSSNKAVVLKLGYEKKILENKLFEQLKDYVIDYIYFIKSNFKNHVDVYKKRDDIATLIQNINHSIKNFHNKSSAFDLAMVIFDRGWAFAIASNDTIRNLEGEELNKFIYDLFKEIKLQLYKHYTENLRNGEEDENNSSNKAAALKLGYERKILENKLFEQLKDYVNDYINYLKPSENNDVEYKNKMFKTLDNKRNNIATLIQNINPSLKNFNNKLSAHNLAMDIFVRGWAFANKYTGIPYLEGEELNEFNDEMFKEIKLQLYKHFIEFNLNVEEDENENESISNKLAALQLAKKENKKKNEIRNILKKFLKDNHFEIHNNIDTLDDSHLTAASYDIMEKFLKDMIKRNNPDVEAGDMYDYLSSEDVGDQFVEYITKKLYELEKYDDINDDKFFEVNYFVKRYFNGLFGNK